MGGHSKVYREAATPSLGLLFQVTMEEASVGEHLTASGWWQKRELSFARLLVWVPSHVFKFHV